MTAEEHLAQAVAEHHQHEAKAGEALEHARRAGDHLRHAKANVRATLGHGHWAQWLKEHWPLSQNTAIDYMKLAKYWVPEFSQHAVNLSLRAALKEIALARPHLEARRARRT